MLRVTERFIQRRRGAFHAVVDGRRTAQSIVTAAAIGVIGVGVVVVIVVVGGVVVVA
jgi:hypothetical protein